MKTIPIPVMDAYDIARRFGYDQVIILARKVDTPEHKGCEHVTTSGMDKAHRDSAARTGNFLKHRVMHWPEQAGVNEQLAKLQADHNELMAMATEILLADEGALLEMRNLGFQAPVESHEFPNKLRTLLTKLGAAI